MNLKKLHLFNVPDSPFSLEGEGWDEGDIKGCFYSPHPNPLQQERELDYFVTHCICNAKSCVDTYVLYP